MVPAYPMCITSTLSTASRAAYARVSSRAGPASCCLWASEDLDAERLDAWPGGLAQRGTGGQGIIAAAQRSGCSYTTFTSMARSPAVSDR